MNATISIEMDNTAFEDAKASETARILRELATKIEDAGEQLGAPTYGVIGIHLRDINGNIVGQFRIND